MGIGQMGFLLMLFSDLVHLLASPSPDPLHETLGSAYVQEQVGVEKINKKLSTMERGGGVVSVNRRGGGGGSHGGGASESHGGGSADAGGSSSSTGESAGGDTSKTPNTAAGVIPVYAAGAMNHHGNQHHGAGCRIGSNVGLTNLGAVILASVTLHLRNVWM